MQTSYGCLTFCVILCKTVCTESHSLRSVACDKIAQINGRKINVKQAYDLRIICTPVGRASDSMMAPA